VTQVNKALQQLDQVIQQNASASEELASTAEELSSQSEQLQSIVEFFKLSDRRYQPRATTASANKARALPAHHSAPKAIAAKERRKIDLHSDDGQGDEDFENF
jgi:methyl-accepting chemotaxis protein